jgi:DNA-binding response OmpR family regulator
MDPEPSPTSQAGGKPDDPAEAGRPTVLLVEDHADMRSYVRRHLAPHYDVLEAARGDAGLELARAELPDAVVSDIMMPGLDGHALCRALKSDLETDLIPVILLTAKADRSSRLEGLEGGADDYLTKPFDPAELLVRIRNLLLNRARLKARFATQAPGAAASPSRLPAWSVTDAFRDRIQTVLERESHQGSFDVESLGRHLGVSRVQLFRRVKETCGLSPSELIIRFRLERATPLLLQRAGTVGEVAYAVGFGNLSHFIRRFRQQYGQTPAAYAAGRGTRKPITDAAE